MRHPTVVAALVLPAVLAAQNTTPRPAPDGVIAQFVRFADIFGGRLVTAFDSIPADRYGYRPAPTQQTIGFIAQHLEDANYALCERLGGRKASRTAKDSLADTVKAQWPKDTLIARLDASLRFCDEIISRLPKLDSPAVASTLLAFETDLAEHYAQLSVYMRLLGLVPPSALQPKQRTAVELPASSLPAYAGVYQLDSGLELEVTLREGALFVRSSVGGEPVRLWPESPTDFFVKEVDAQITFRRDSGGGVTGLILHQFFRHRPGTRIR